MDVFLTLLTNLIPLYILIGLGFFGARHLGVGRDALANLVIFIAMPIVVFGFVVDLEFQASYFILPIVIYAVQTVIGLGFLNVGRKIYDGAEANILAMSASMGNTGYFGLPLALILFNKEQVAIYIFMNIGTLLYESTIGYYIAARGRFNVRDSIIKLIKFPVLYAIILALIVNQINVQLPDQFYTYWTYFKGAYVISGMMIIGAALAGIDKLMIGPRFLGAVFVGKFLAWPALVLGYVMLDKLYFGMFNQDIYSLLLVLSIVPPAANIAAFASQLDLVPEKAATTILLGTVFALFYIPFVLMISGL